MAEDTKPPEPKPEPPFEAQLVIIVQRAANSQTPLPRMIFALDSVLFELRLLHLQIQQAESAKVQPLIQPANGSRFPIPPSRQ
jgi:hypothetical protein